MHMVEKKCKILKEIRTFVNQFDLINYLNSFIQNPDKQTNM